MATPVRDRFDAEPNDVLRVGAHRAPRQRGRGWIGFAWAALATVVLIAVGLFTLSLLNPDLDISLPTDNLGQGPGADTPMGEDAEPMLDPEVSISVLNGTAMSGLATRVGDKLEALGWDGAALGEGSRANAAQDDVQTTQIFYSDPANEGAARMLIEHLGVGVVRLSNNYPASPITVLIGSDYSQG